MARERPEYAVVVLTPDQAIARRLTTVWGVHVVTAANTTSICETVNLAATVASNEGFASPGEKVSVIAVVSFGQLGSPNTLRTAFVHNQNEPRREFLPPKL